MKKTVFLFLCVLLSLTNTYSQKIGLKTNAIQWFLLTPNIGAEIEINKKLSFNIYGGFNPFQLKNDRQWKFYYLQPELRYWLKDSFKGHFFGIDGAFGHYNMARTPIITPKDDEGNRYEGTFGLIGLSYGYQWVLSRRWHIEASLGFGYVRTSYEIFINGKNGQFLGRKIDHQILPTTAAISIIYLIKNGKDK